MSTINDREWAFLAQETGQPGPFNDMYFKYLRGLGYTGTLQDMIAKYGEGFSPSGGGALYDPDASSLFNRFTTPPSVQRKQLISDTIKAVKTAGVWTKLDALYLMAAADEQAARQNWITDQFNLTASNSPTFTADRGFAGDGSSSFLDSGFNPATAVSPKFTLNSAVLGIFSRSNINNATYYDVGNAGARFNVRSATGSTMRGNINDALVTNFGANGTSVGLFAINRSGSNARQGYWNGAAHGGDTQVSTAVTSANMQFLRGSTNYSTRQLAVGFIGASLTAGEHAAFHTALLTYLQTIGAA